MAAAPRAELRLVAGFALMPLVAVFWLVALEGSELVRTDATTGG